MKTLLRNCLTALVACAAFGQVVPKTPAFEVADVQCSKPDAKPARPRFLPGGRVDLHGITLKLMIMAAYGVQDDLVIGGPAWLDADRFDVVAKAVPDTPDATLYLMLRTLLAERFHLAIHNEDKALPAYALTVVKTALLKAATGSAQPDCAWQEGAPGRIRRVCHNISMPELARQIPLWGRANIDLPVKDLTGITGAYDIELEWSLPVDGAESSPPFPAILDAMPHAGLRLEPRKLPMSVLVIDHVERVLVEQ
jgi:uncharacterized protein (TIGR03435 family)